MMVSELEFQLPHSAAVETIKNLLNMFCCNVKITGHMKIRGRYFTKLNCQMALSLILTLILTLLFYAFFEHRPLVFSRAKITVQKETSSSSSSSLIS